MSSSIAANKKDLDVLNKGKLMRTTDAFRICPACGQETPANARFCMHCAAPVAQHCPACGSEAPPTARFCPNCAQALNPNVKQAPVTASGAIASGTAGESEEKPASTAGLPNAAAASQHLFKEGETHLKAGHPEQALTAFEQAIRRDERNARAYRGRGDVLRALKRYEEALAAYDQAIVLDPADAISYGNKGVVFFHLQRYEEALRFLNQAIQRDPKDTALYNNKGAALRELGHYQEALAAYDQTIQLDPGNVNAYTGKGYALNSLQRPGEAQAAFDWANRLKASASQPLPPSRSAAPAVQRTSVSNTSNDLARQLRQTLFGTLTARIITTLVVAVMVIGGGITVTSLSHGSGSSGTPSGFQQLSSSLFSIGYPGNWHYEDNSVGGQIFYSFFPNDSSLEGEALNVGILPQNAPIPPSYMYSYCTGIPGSQEGIAPVMITISGQTWEQEDCGPGTNGTHLTVDETFYKGRDYILKYLAINERFDTAKAQVFLPMEQSFAFLT
jgi:tetratricopeptide (TPR) repeat protein